MNPRSLLFVPGTKTELLAKVPRWQPDVVIVDLEDAVSEAEKDAARLAVAEADFAAAATTVLVRVNPPGKPWHELDVAACLDTTAAGIVLPKTTPSEMSTTSSVSARPPNLLPVAPPVSTPR